MINDFLNKMFLPVVEIVGTFWFIVIISLAISFLITIIYKLATNQKLMKQIKEDLATLQKKIKELTKTNPEKALELQQQMMKKNSVYMKHSFKPTLYTLLPLLLLFGWLSATFSFVPLEANETFEIVATFSKQDGQTASIEIPQSFSIVGETEKTIDKNIASWKIRSSETGIFDINVNLNNQTCGKRIIIAESGELKAASQKEACEKPLRTVEIKYEKLMPAGYNFSILGWRPGWLGWYIFLSILSSTLFRKLLKIY